MRWYLGYPVLASGLAFGFHMFLPSSPDLLAHHGDMRAEARLTTGSLITTGSLAEHAPIIVDATTAGLSGSSRLSAFSPGVRLAGAEIPRSSFLDYLARKLTFADADASTASTPAQPVTIEPWKSSVVLASSSTARDGILDATGESQRTALTRDIQRELSRAGCYAGEIDGIWGPGSRRAILIFMDRVNALLPTNDPDVFMLSLLRSQSGAVCGATCPAGQSLTHAGRCVPNVILAKADRRGEPQNPGVELGDRIATALPQSPTSRGRDGGDVSGAAPTLADAALPKSPLGGRMGIGVASLETEARRSDWPRDGAEGWARDRTLSGDAQTLDRTAELETTSSDAVITTDADGAGEIAPQAYAPITATKPPSAAKTPRAKSMADGRSSPRKTAYRHVQRLFEHPLGRM